MEYNTNGLTDFFPHPLLLSLFWVLKQLEMMILCLSHSYLETVFQILTNYDVTNRKHYMDPIYSIIQKRTILARNKSVETTVILL